MEITSEMWALFRLFSQMWITFFSIDSFRCLNLSQISLNKTLKQLDFGPNALLLAQVHPQFTFNRGGLIFFTMMLASPTAYKWASDFLGSTTLSHLDDQSTSTSATIPFYLPQSQPQTDLLLCSKNLPSSEKSLEHHTLIKTLSSSSSPEQLSPCSAVDMTSPTTPPKKLREKIAKTSGPWSKSLLTLVAKGKDPADITEPKARRRLRQKQIHKGYKASPYSNRNCLGCSMDPPTLSHSIIKNLGATVCKIDPTKLSLKELSMVKKPSSPGGKKQSGTSSKGANDNEVQKTAKNKAKK
jgi:hypothetical protein